MSLFLFFYLFIFKSKCPFYLIMLLISFSCLLSFSFIRNMFFNFFDFNCQLQYYLHPYCHFLFLPTVITTIVIDIYCQITLLFIFIVADMSFHATWKIGLTFSFQGYPTFIIDFCLFHKSFSFFLCHLTGRN